MRQSKRSAVLPLSLVSVVLAVVATAVSVGWLGLRSAWVVLPVALAASPALVRAVRAAGLQAGRASVTPAMDVVRTTHPGWARRLVPAGLLGLGAIAFALQVIRPQGTGLWLVTAVFLVAMSSRYASWQCFKDGSLGKLASASFGAFLIGLGINLLASASDNLMCRRELGLTVQTLRTEFDDAAPLRVELVDIVREQPDGTVRPFGWSRGTLHLPVTGDGLRVKLELSRPSFARAIYVLPGRPPARLGQVRADTQASSAVTFPDQGRVVDLADPGAHLLVIAIAREESAVNKVLEDLMTRPVTPRDLGRGAWEYRDDVWLPISSGRVETRASGTPASLELAAQLFRGLESDSPKGPLVVAIAFTVE